MNKYPRHIPSVKNDGRPQRSKPIPYARTPAYRQPNPARFARSPRNRAKWTKTSLEIAPKWPILHAWFANVQNGSKWSRKSPCKLRAGRGIFPHSFLDEEVCSSGLWATRPAAPPHWTASKSERPKITPPHTLTSPPARPSSPSPASSQVGSTRARRRSAPR